MNTHLWPILAAGILAGLIHVLSGPDHLAAIAPLALRQSKAWLIGLRWGFGHAAGVVAVGMVSLLLRGALPLDLISTWSDRLVGLALIGVGCWTFRQALRVHTHEHSHEGETHAHIHAHGRKVPPRRAESHRHTHAAFGIGTLHGLAGSSHFLAIIPSLALPTTSLAVGYLMAYGFGTVLAMAGFAEVLSRITVGVSRRANFHRAALFTCAAFAFAIGGAWMAGFGF
jgi:hypothetical protein